MPKIARRLMIGYRLPVTGCQLPWEPATGNWQLPKHLHARKPLPLGVEYMDRAGHAGIERVDGAEHFERVIGLRDRVAEQRGLVRSDVAFLVARAGVPCGRDDGLVVFDLA